MGLLPKMQNRSPGRYYAVENDRKQMSHGKNAEPATPITVRAAGSFSIDMTTLPVAAVFSDAIIHFLDSAFPRMILHQPGKQKDCKKDAHIRA